jgi:uncharacterized membrane protein YhaH (DUF805 family)
MLAAIKYNLTHLTQFGGRDARQTFWFYVLFLVLVHVGVSMAISIPLTGSMLGDTIVAARQGTGEAEVQRRMMEHMGTLMRASMWVSAGLSLAMLALLGASFTRRLHDSGKPGWIAGVAAAIQLIALALAIARIDEAIRMVELVQSGNIEAARTMQSQFAVQSLLGWVPAALVIVFGVMASTAGDNRYGPEPQPN